MATARRLSKGAQRKPIRRNSSRRPIVGVPATLDFQNEEERWEALEERLRAGVLARKTSEKALPPYDKPRSYLKREIFRYVLERQEDGRATELQRCIERVREGYVPTTPAFPQNPFHWALLGVQHIEILDLGSDDVSRFGRQLAYAAQHNVPPPLLVGFIYQTGSPALISKKYAGAEREEWHGSLQRGPVVRP